MSAELMKSLVSAGVRVAFLAGALFGLLKIRVPMRSGMKAAGAALLVGAIALIVELVARAMR